MDWVVEKATELGVHEIRPIQGGFAPGPGRVRRWSRIARSAAKQCCRGCVPEVHAPASLDLHLAELPAGGRRLLADFGGESPSNSRLQGDRVVLAVGHDSGFGTAEIELLKAAGFETVSLGSRRLRTETAVVTLLALFLSAE
jgi:16S rRNA (uracil1498-N3)-methyltransferase